MLPALPETCRPRCGRPMQSRFHSCSCCLRFWKGEILPLLDVNGCDLAVHKAQWLRCHGHDAEFKRQREPCATSDVHCLLTMRYYRTANRYILQQWIFRPAEPLEDLGLTHKIEPEAQIFQLTKPGDEENTAHNTIRQYRNTIHRSIGTSRRPASRQVLVQNRSAAVPECKRNRGTEKAGLRNVKPFQARIFQYGCPKLIFF